MNLISISWKNVIHKPLTALLSILLFALGIGLITVLLLMNTQIRENFDKNLAGIDLVIGAKGSPLQLILSSMYHIDVPTGNIPLKEVRPFLNPEHPLIRTAVPLSLGDSHKGYRIIGTTHDMLGLYGAEVARGEIWKRDFEVTVGSDVAASGLRIGDTFLSTHGFLNDDDLAHDHAVPFKVVGILARTGTVIDRLILTNTQSIWDVHGHAEDKTEEGDHADQEGHDHAEGTEDHDDHDHEGHDHDHDHHDHHHAHEEEDDKHYLKTSLLEETDEAITTVLVQYKSKTNIQALNMLRSINENTGLQAASPAFEMNRLYSLIGVGTDALRNLALIIAVVSALSIFISLFNSLRERKYELALMRVLGGGRSTLFLLILFEGLILSALGGLFGLLAGHVAMSALSGLLTSSYGYRFTGMMFLQEEVYIFIAALILGVIAATIPAIQAARTDIHATLTDR